ncbi:MAG: T9SS type A sorting domain-containing protein [Bacteroidota bacterium]
MRQIFLLLFLGLTQMAIAQLEDNSIAPNWILTDIDGRNHDLYSYLNRGKTVYLEFSATWSGDSWAYHNNGYLNRLYKEYGPNGTGEVMVIMIEGDLQTSEDEIHGNGQRTYGNWLSNTDYPIIDDHSLNRLYNITSWPMLYVICPNKRLRSVGLQSTQTLYRHSRDCENPWGRHNVSILSYDGDHESFCRSKELSPIISIQNEGTDTLKYCSIEFSLNGTVVEEREWRGTLAPFEASQISFSPQQLNEESWLSFRAASPNYEPDEYMQHNELDGILIKSPKTGLDIQLTIHTDNWPEENAWSIKGPSGYFVSSEDFDSLKADALHYYEFQLPRAGCYEFEMTDSYGNGLAHGELWPGQFENGAILLRSGQDVIWDNASFGFGFSIPFEASPVTVSQSNVAYFADFNTFPNPVTNLLNIVFEPYQSASYQFMMYNTLGQLVKSSPAQLFDARPQETSLDCSDLDGGIYWLVLQSEDGIRMQRKIIVQK